jgi:hypothetical protein
VLQKLTEDRGEFTIVVDIGQTTSIPAHEPPAAALLAIEFGEMTSIGGLTRRQALSRLAKRYHIPTNELYDALEQNKKSVERPT